MVNQETYNVNVCDDNNGEIMIPYDRVLFISWDKKNGDKLKELRRKRGLTRPTLSKLTRGAVSLRTVTVLERGEVNSVSREKLDLLLNILYADIRDLFPTVTVNFTKTP